MSHSIDIEIGEELGSLIWSMPNDQNTFLQGRIEFNLIGFYFLFI